MNIGPDGENLTVRQALDIFSQSWGEKLSINISPDNNKPEKARLELDVSLAHELGIKNAMSQSQAISQAAEWYRKFHAGESALALTNSEIENYFNVHA